VASASKKQVESNQGEGETTLSSLTFVVTGSARRFVRAGVLNAALVLIAMYLSIIGWTGDGVSMWEVLWAAIGTGCLLVFYWHALARVDRQGETLRIVRAIDTVVVDAQDVESVRVGRVGWMGLIWGQIRRGTGEPPAWFVFSEMGARDCAGPACLDRVKRAFESAGIVVDAEGNRRKKRQS
jgi:hypothetical protein